MKEAEPVCGRSKGPLRHKETWLLNELGEKRHLFLMWKKSEPGEEKRNDEAYRKANKQDKRIIYNSKDDNSTNL